jgi:asparaginyl-tRNA synthetase
MDLKSLYAKLETNKENFSEMETEIQGWALTARHSKTFSFVSITDGSTQNPMQVVLDANMPGYDKLKTIRIGFSLKAKGKIVPSQGKGQSFEMQASEVEIIGDAPETYPLQKKATSLEFLRTISHLRPRTRTIGAVFRIRHALSYAVHKFFNDRGFYYVHTPIITASDCEGAGEMFQVTTLDLEKLPKSDGKTAYQNDFFGRKAYLTVSGQLNAEALALSLGKVYTFGPTFRAENSNTPRHLSEFWMIEPEVAFMDLKGNQDLARDFLVYLIEYTLKNCPNEIDFLQSKFEDGLVEKLEHAVKAEFVRVDYTQAVDILEKSKVDFEYPVKWGEALQTEHERFLAEEHFKAPVIVSNYPKDFKPFYMRVNDDDKTVAAMDVLLPRVGEIIGGSQREERLDVLLERIKELKMEENVYDWFVDLRKYGSVVHSGFGLGFERIVMYVSGMKNIRDVIPFPRAPNSAEY